MSKSILLLTVSIFSFASAADLEESSGGSRGGVSALVRQLTQTTAPTPKNEGQLHPVWGQAKGVTFFVGKHVGVPIGIAYGGGSALMAIFESQQNVRGSWGYTAYAVGQIFSNEVGCVCMFIICYATYYMLDKVSALVRWFSNP